MARRPGLGRDGVVVRRFECSGSAIRVPVGACFSHPTRPWTMIPRSRRASREHPSSDAARPGAIRPAPAFDPSRTAACLLRRHCFRSCGGAQLCHAPAATPNSGKPRNGEWFHDASSHHAPGRRSAAVCRLLHPGHRHGAPRNRRAADRELRAGLRCFRLRQLPVPRQNGSAIRHPSLAF